MKRVEVPGFGYMKIYTAEDFGEVYTGKVVYFFGTSYRIVEAEDGDGHDVERDEEGNPIPVDTQVLCRGRVSFAPIFFGDVGPGCMVEPLEDDDPEVWPLFAPQPMPVASLVEPDEAPE